MAVNFNAMILPKFGSSFMEGDTARQNALLKDQQMANTQQEMQFRGEERAYAQRQRAEDEAFMTKLNAVAESSGGRLTPEYIKMLAQSRNPQLRATGIEAMERAQRLASQRAAVEQLFPEPPQYKPTFGNVQFGDEAPKAYNALIPQGAQNVFSPGEGLPMSGNQPQFRTRGEFRGAMANPERATAAMAAGMRTIPAGLKDLLADPDTRAMALSLLEKEQKDIPEAKLIALRNSFPVNSPDYLSIQRIIDARGAVPFQTVLTQNGQTFSVPTKSMPGVPPTPTFGPNVTTRPLLDDIQDPERPGVTIRVDLNKYAGGGKNDPGYIGDKPLTSGQTKVTGELQKREGAVSALRSQLEDIRSLHIDLKAAGGKPEVGGNVFTNALNQAAATGLGGVVATAAGSKQQPIRDTIKNSTLLLAKALANASGMTGKELDSNRDIQLLLSSLSTVGQSDQATDDTINLIIRWVELNQKPIAGGAAPATGGGKPPATGGGKPPAAGGKPASTGVDMSNPLLR